MPTYDIYGIGSAIVDTEIFVSENFLVKHKIKKGLMTLVDSAKLDAILDDLTRLGSSLVKKSGGSACNSIVAASELGASAYFSGKIAKDLDGDLFKTDLKGAGVFFSNNAKDPGITGKCLVFVTPDAERTMLTFLGINNYFSKSEIDQDILLDSSWFFVEGYLLTDEVRTSLLKDKVLLAKKHNVKVALSLSDSALVASYRNNFYTVFGDGIDLIFCNAAEALTLTQKGALSEACVALGKITKTFVITDGALGALVFNGQKLKRTHGFKVDATDTNGAGDMFAGAFLYGLSKRKDFDWCATLANYCASRVVTKVGPRLEESDYSLIQEKFNLLSK